MSNANGEQKRLTVEDPVPQETMMQLGQLRDARAAAGLQMIDLEQRKIQLLAAVKRIDEQNQRLFDAILVERGLAPGTPIELDGPTGKLTVLDSKQAASASEEQPSEEQAPAS